MEHLPAVRTAERTVDLWVVLLAVWRAVTWVSSWVVDSDAQKADLMVALMAAKMAV